MRDTIDMAREAGFPMAWISDSGVIRWKDIKAFEALVRADAIADEREAVEDLLKEYDMVNSAFAKDFRARGETK